MPETTVVQDSDTPKLTSRHSTSAKKDGDPILHALTVVTCLDHLPSKNPPLSRPPPLVVDPLTIPAKVKWGKSASIRYLVKSPRTPNTQRTLNLGKKLGRSDTHPATHRGARDSGAQIEQRPHPTRVSSLPSKRMDHKLKDPVAICGFDRPQTRKRNGVEVEVMGIGEYPEKQRRTPILNLWWWRAMTTSHESRKGNRHGTKDYIRGLTKIRYPPPLVTAARSPKLKDVKTPQGLSHVKTTTANLRECQSCQDEEPDRRLKAPYYPPEAFAPVLSCLPKPDILPVKKAAGSLLSALSASCEDVDRDRSSVAAGGPDNGPTDRERQHPEGCIWVVGYRGLCCGRCSERLSSKGTKQDEYANLISILDEKGGKSDVMARVLTPGAVKNVAVQNDIFPPLLFAVERRTDYVYGTCARLLAGDRLHNSEFALPLEGDYENFGSRGFRMGHTNDEESGAERSSIVLPKRNVTTTDDDSYCPAMIQEWKAQADARKLLSPGSLASLQPQGRVPKAPKAKGVSRTPVCLDVNSREGCAQRGELEMSVCG
ncbi:hypothetical protein K474DRAFT_1736908 [Panus rudis PR-1116 ss-1]|nr:hypothetical protein K474DRAFT_1736908 [Panus rudis PR-1116 ss-1]